MMIRNRVKELRRVPARELLPNPKNWRAHPPAQQNALRGLLAELGYCDAAIARELPDGQLQLIDGHLRCETTPDMEVPVLVLDVTEAEADKLLLTLDPLASLAEADRASLTALLATVETDSATLDQSSPVFWVISARRTSSSAGLRSLVPVSSLASYSGVQRAFLTA